MTKSPTAADASGAPSADEAVVARDLTQVFGRRKALDKVSFTLPAGSFLTIFGPNGAGKTTLLRLLATLDRPRSGKLWIAGCDAEKAPEAVRRRVGLISHAPMLYPDLTALENLVFFGSLYGTPNVDRRALELLSAVGLRLRRDDRVRTFSRGMTQRLAIARALIHDPSIILLDEPYAGLDPRASAIFDELIEGVREGRTLVMVSHDRERGLALCTHGLLLSSGHVVGFGPKETLDLGLLTTLYDGDLPMRKAAARG